MRIIIQNKENKKFYHDSLGWVQNASLATHFASALEAFQFSMENRLGDVEILFQLTDGAPQSIIRRPVPEEQMAA